MYLSLLKKLTFIRTSPNYTLPREMPFLQIYRREKTKKLPVVLSREEVWKILGLVKDVRYRACLTLIYSCGLRCGEAVNVKVGDIDSGQGLLYIRNGKGCKSRAVPLPSKTLKILREMWRTHHHPELLFPAYHLNMRLNPSRYGCKDKPFSASTVGTHFRAALYCSGCRKTATVHSLRHAFATNLLEEGIPLFTVNHLVMAIFKLHETMLYIVSLASRIAMLLNKDFASWLSNGWVPPPNIFWQRTLFIWEPTIPMKR